MYFNLLWNEFAALPEVEAIALGGSRAGADYDEKSDYEFLTQENRHRHRGDELVRSQFIASVLLLAPDCMRIKHKYL